MKLFYYEHCPYCIRTLMVIIYKKMNVERIVLANDDETTPIQMIGKKMLPVLAKDDGSYLPESLDIVDYLDHLDNPVLNYDIKMTNAAEKVFDDLMPIHKKLVLPRMPQPLFREFQTPSARDYFTHKKEKMTGPFKDCLTNTNSLIKEILPLLEIFADHIQCDKNTLSLEDIQIYPWLYLLQIVKELTLPASIQGYLKIKNEQLNDREGVLKLNIIS